MENKEKTGRNRRRQKSATIEGTRKRKEKEGKKERTKDGRMGGRTRKPANYVRTIFVLCIVSISFRFCSTLFDDVFVFDEVDDDDDVNSMRETESAAE